MNEVKCSECGEMWPEEQLVIREDTGEKVCRHCSGLMPEDEKSCLYDEEG